MSTERTAKPFGIRKATARSTEPVRRFTTEAAAIAAARLISHDQGGAAWIVSGPNAHEVISFRKPVKARKIVPAA